MGSELSQGGVTVLDDWDNSTTFATGLFDRLDITAFNGDVLRQVLTPNNDWQPPAGALVRAGLFKSTPGLSAIYPPGPTMVRFKRANRGVGATVDFEIAAPDA
jgi:hypothetical protein